MEALGITEIPETVPPQEVAANGCLNVIPEVRVSGKYGTCTPLGLDRAEDAAGGFPVLDQFDVALGDEQVALREHHGLVQVACSLGLLKVSPRLRSTKAVARPYRPRDPKEGH